MNQENNIIKEKFQKISHLVKSPGYLYVLLFMIQEDIEVPISQIEDVNPLKRISVKEATLLLGLLIKHNKEKILQEPKDIYTFLNLRKETYRILEELHFAMNEDIKQKMQETINRLENGENAKFPTNKELGNAKYQRECFFYTNEPAYDLEYVKFAPYKYKYDQEWLSQHKGFNINEVIQIAINIKIVLTNRRQEIISYSKERTEEICKLDKRLIKNPIALEKAQNFHSLYRYEKLLCTHCKDEKGKDYFDYINCHNLCKILLEYYTLDETFATEQIGYSAFLKNFSFNIIDEENQYFDEPGGYNIITSKPIINIDEKHSLLPIPYLLFQSIYESPYYWFLEDSKYKKRAGSHLGKSAEDMVYNLMYPVFGKTHTYKGAIIKHGKQEISDIDILCILGNKALCIQVKTKKLTERAQTGDDESYKKDFKGAISDAYHQGIVCKEAILSHDNHIYSENNKEIDIKSIDDVFILCVTTGFYQAIPHQVRLLLDLNDDKTTPVVLNLFDLHIITHYLTDPFDFLYYIRQRIATNDYFHAMNESILLSYHLSHKLWKDPKYSYKMLDQDFAQGIDNDYINIFHIDNENIAQDDSLTCQWISQSYKLFLWEIKNTSSPNKTDILFHLYDCSNESERILSMINSAKDRSLKNQSTVSFCMIFDDGKLGVSYTSSAKATIEDLLDRMQIYTVKQKYQSKADKWIGLGSIANHLNNIDVIIYDKNPWIKDEDIEGIVKMYDTLTNKLHIATPNSKKIGRNDPCPCGSGLKYKKCHGKR